MHRLQICLCGRPCPWSNMKRERGLLTSGNKDVKCAEEIIVLLEAMNLPDQVATMHCPEHKRDGSQTSQGNQTADKTARQAAREPPPLEALVPWLDVSKFQPHYAERGEEWPVSGESLTLIPILCGKSTPMV